MTKHDGPVEESTGLSFDLTQKSDACSGMNNRITALENAGGLDLVIHIPNEKLDGVTNLKEYFCDVKDTNSPRLVSVDNLKGKTIQGLSKDNNVNIKQLTDIMICIKPSYNYLSYTANDAYPFGSFSFNPSNVHSTTIPNISGVIRLYNNGGNVNMQYIYIS